MLQIFLEINRKKNLSILWIRQVNISVNSILKLADKFNVTTDYLLGRDDENNFNNKLIKALRTCFKVSKPILEELINRKDKSDD